MQGAVDEQRLAKAEERVKRTQVERELEAEREKAARAERLVEGFASGAAGGVGVREEEEDEEEEVVVGEAAREGGKGVKAREGKKKMAVEVPSEVPSGRAAAAKVEAARAQTVASFLNELDTPQPAPAVKSAKLLASKPPPMVSSKSSLEADYASHRPSSSSTGSSRLAAAAVEKPRSSSRPASSRSSDPSRRAAVESQTRPSSSSTHKSTAPTPAAPASSSSSCSAERKSALAGILALGQSPEVGAGDRVLHSVRTTTTTTTTSATGKVTAAASGRPRAEGRASKENALPGGRERERELVRPLREGERYKVF